MQAIDDAIVAGALPHWSLFEQCSYVGTVQRQTEKGELLVVHR